MKQVQLMSLQKPQGFDVITEAKLLILSTAHIH